MNPNSVSAVFHKNSLKHSLSIPNEENIRKLSPNFRDEKTGTENRELSQPLTVHRMPLREFNYEYKYKDSNSRLLFAFKRRAEVSVNNYILLQEMLSEIESLLKNEYNWDEIGYRKPTPEDITRAKSVLREFVSTIGYEGYFLKKPYISNSENGGATIEWDTDERSLHLEITQHNSVITKMWDEPDRSVIDTKPLLKEDYLLLWKWINE